MYLSKVNKGTQVGTDTIRYIQIYMKPLTPKGKTDKYNKTVPK